MMQFSFEAKIIHWRGPAPFFFVPLPAEHAAEIGSISKRVSYGWGMIPVEAAIGGLAFRTALFPKDETYLLPLKAEIRRKGNMTVDDLVLVEMSVEGAPE